MDAPKPLGYWLKHLHNLLDKQFDATLADVGLGRRHWQILNTLARGEATRDELTAALAPFLSPGEPDLDGVLEDVTARGWTRPGLPPEGNLLSLADEGRAAHADIAARVDATRAAVLKGLTPGQYAETVRILSVMAGNVEADLAAR
ncbi:MarR family winged helix-turn-helix transcriptional regulator [Streptomyces botrytidirepellens]|uniref:MarR family winged helix-turn-helix transcriptional regulator n=1 Tax=Streptomyces botrytidirepellens TaxID=2486417 RepID=UPI001C8332CE|nr:MarR family transcriptional regulator [Streptomyces botrytidirepellens]